MKDDDVFVMPDGSPLELRWVKETYGRRGQQLGFLKAIRGIRNERFLGPMADRICRREKKDVVVFGHNHKAGIDKDWWFRSRDRIYANTGGWCGLKRDGSPKTPLTYLEIEMDDGAPGATVRLYEAKDGGVEELLDKESV